MWVACLDKITILDALDLQVTRKFCIEDIIELLVRVWLYWGGEKGELDFQQLYVGHLFDKA